METQTVKSAIFCDHANEVPVYCLCSPDCYCKEHTCKPRIGVPLPNRNEDPIEIYEQAIAKMREWLGWIYSSSKVDRALKTQFTGYYPKLHIRAKIWTTNNVYSINGHLHILNNDPSGYLCCGAQSRKFRTGEDWFRGNDLPDGNFSEETWREILCGIVRYEAEEIKSEKWKDVIH